MTVRLTVVLLLAASLAAVDAGPARTYTYADLVGRLIDLQVLAVPPLPGESCRLFSSYDRRSRFDAAGGRYLDWDANNDGSGIIRREGDADVLAEMDGPGVIWRMWSATAGEGHVKVYLDGAAEPAIDLPFKDYFNRYDQAKAPFAHRSLNYMTNANGFNNYIPIPYQKSCKIIAEKNWGQFYQFTCTTFPAGTVLPTFTRNLPATDLAAIDRVEAFLKERLGQDPAGARPGQVVERKAITAQPGQRTLVAELDGQRAISALEVRLDPMPAPGDLDTLRELCMRITWDGDPTPAVWAPLGDFFGSAPGLNLLPLLTRAGPGQTPDRFAFHSLPLGMDAERFYSCWYMPFANKARIEVVNDGTVARKIGFGITHAPWRGAVDSALRFHAVWHRDLPPLPEPERRIDWPLLQVGGAGRLVGVMLAIWNPRGGWWGEGDEKFYVDGERFPSSFGTGSEDYFGYAWSAPNLFQQAFHGQTRSDGMMLAGHLSVHRWQIADNVPFHDGFLASIEKYLPNQRCQFAATVTWYQAAGATAPYPEAPLAERTRYYVAPFRMPCAIEAEFLAVIEKPAGRAGRQDMEKWTTPTRQWSLGSQLLWSGARPGDTLILGLPIGAENAPVRIKGFTLLPVATEGSYQLAVRMTTAKDAGIVQFSLDGTPIGQPIDLAGADTGPGEAITLGTARLAAGGHKLGLAIVGTHDQATTSVGFDYLTLTVAP